MRTKHLALALAAAIVTTSPALGLQKTIPGGAIPDLNVGPLTTKPPTAEAGTSLECGGKTYHVTTGTTGGKCTQSTDSNGNVYGVQCTDGNNWSSASCGKGCGTSSGAGDCDKK